MKLVDLMRVKPGCLFDFGKKGNPEKFGFVVNVDVLPNGFLEVEYYSLYHLDVRYRYLSGKETFLCYEPDND